MPGKSRQPGKFWPWIRELILEKVKKLHAADYYEGHEENVTPPTRKELREDGYFYTAKLIVPREVNRALADRR